MNPTYSREDSKVELQGFEARHYDWLLNLATAGTYPYFLHRVVRDMAIQPDDAILDLASGTGRNACLMVRDLSDRGRLVGLDIGPEMLEQAERRCQHLPNVTVEKQRIEEILPYHAEFDKVLIAFALHGFVQDDRLRILTNGHRALRTRGQLLILDYDEFEPEESSWLVRFVSRHFECPLATDFVRRDWKEILRQQGFGDFRIHHYYKGYVRLLRAVKLAEAPRATRS